ncbi:MAG: amidohydrolase [Clostridiaceae bacterium]|jgi:predicted TIM-barrel fold metal-dependent hydrolase|nr:amidohydrolase [Clostridiaceae bacterium]
MIDNYMIVDGHTHTYPTDEKATKILDSFTTLYKMEPTSIGKGTIEEVILNMERDCIDYTILANFAPAKILHANNLWTIEMAKRYKRFVPLISINPDMEGDILAHLKQYILLGAKGIKIHSSAQDFLPNSDNLQPVYEYCNETRFPIFFHCGLTSEVRFNNYSDLDMLLGVIDKYQNIPIVLGHMAEGMVNDVLWLSKAYGNIFFDTSIAITGLLCIKRVHDNCWQDDEVVIDIVRKVGANRIVFGSDYPFGSPIHDIKRFIQMKLTDEEKGMILGVNAVRVFNIETEQDKNIILNCNIKLQ